MAGSNIIEFRIIRRFQDEAKTVKIDERIQFRTKDVIIAVLGINLGSWSDWQDFDAIEVVETVGSA